MSSKSRKKTPRSGSAKPAASAADGPDSSSQVEPAPHEFAEELIQVPKDKNRLQFILLIGLLIFLLIIFVVPSQLTQMTGAGGGGDDIVATWQHPTKGKMEVTANQLITGMREIDLVFSFDIFLPYAFGIDPQNLRRLGQEDYVRIFVLGQLAEDAGVHISDKDLATMLRAKIDLPQQYGGFGGAVQSYQAWAASQGGASVVESSLRRVFRARRFLDLMGQVSGVPAPTAIEEAWNADHVEHAFDYAQIEVASLDEEARALAPANDELSTWFEGRPQFERQALMRQERRSARFAVFEGLDTTPAEGLVAAYPSGDEIEPAERARNYYDRVFFLRFKRPAKEPADEGEEATDESEPPPSDFLEYEEVQDVCLAEAPVYYAMDAWLKDLRARRDAGETVELEAEAARLGLGFRAADEAKSLADYSEDEAIGGRNVGIMVFQTNPGELAPTVQIGEKAFTVVETLSKLDPELPPFDEIRDQVLDNWVREKSQALAVERLQAIWQGFPVATASEEEAEEDVTGESRVIDEAAFRAAVTAAGLEVLQRDWLDRSAGVDADPKRDDPAHVFLRIQTSYFDLGEGEVAEPTLNRTKTHAFLVRHVGEREVPIDRMTESDYTMYKNRALSASKQAFATGFDTAWLEANYGLWVEDPSDEDEPAKTEG